ncbi:MAG: MerR family transcriptional regulator, partial [Lapillicoccus sp.]
MAELATDTALSVGATAARLGVAPETLRSWGRRYGLMPSLRTDGGHRRYTPADLALLLRMQQLVGTGVTPAKAAQAVQLPGSEALDAVGGAFPRRRSGGPGGRVLAVPGASPEVRGLARAASRLDSEALHGILSDLLAERGAVATWDDVLRPLLLAAGLRWAQTGEGIDIEHLLS